MYNWHYDWTLFGKNFTSSEIIDYISFLQMYPKRKRNWNLYHIEIESHGRIKKKYQLLVLSIQQISWVQILNKQIIFINRIQLTLTIEKDPSPISPMNLKSLALFFTTTFSSSFSPSPSRLAIERKNWVYYSMMCKCEDEKLLLRVNIYIFIHTKSHRQTNKSQTHSKWNLSLSLSKWNIDDKYI